MLASPLPPSSLDIYSLSPSYLRCNALCMVISFLVLWSISLGSSLVHFQKGPEYLTRDTAKAFIPFIRFLCYIVTYVDSHLHICTYICRIIHSDATIKTHEGKRRNEGRMIKTQEGRRKKTSLEKYSPLTLLQRFEKVVQGFACERVLETEHKLHILTPLLWPSCCVFLVLLMLGSAPLGLSEVPLGWVWPSLPHLVSTVWNSPGNCFGTQLNSII